MSPAAMRRSVDFPDPERPNNPTISPSRMDTLMSASTGNGLPEGLAKAMQMFRIVRTELLVSKTTAASQSSFVRRSAKA